MDALSTDKLRALIIDLEAKKKELDAPIEDVDAFYKKHNIDPKNIDINVLKSLAENLNKSGFMQNQNKISKSFKNADNYLSSLKKKGTYSDEELKKLISLFSSSLSKDMHHKSEACFVDDNECNHIINSHSIQENGELSHIASKVDNKVQVYSFKESWERSQRGFELIEITQASASYGFCHHHDQIFEPIDKKIATSEQQRMFLISLRSFSHSYHSVKSQQDYFIKYAGNNIQGVESLISPIKAFADAIGMKIPGFDDIEIPIIDEEEERNAKIVRFENYKQTLIDSWRNSDYEKLDYLVYSIKHLAPIVCASWMVMHLQLGGNFSIIKDDDTPYYGSPIILSILPNENKETFIAFSRFKSDSNSEFIFNQLKSKLNNTVQFELEVSKLIIKQTENFYLSPTFWNTLSNTEKAIILNAKLEPRKNFPEKQGNFSMINFFDKKYQIQA